MLRFYLGAALALGAVGCGASEVDPTPSGSVDAGGTQTTDQLPDFALVDMNDTSATSGDAVSPRDFLQKVSGWYFTHAS